MPKIHMLHGYIATGKTTAAKSLEGETGAIRFSIDEWMSNFYGDNPDQKHFGEYEDAIKHQIWQLTEKLINRNIDVILDFGFWTKSERAYARAKAIEFGATPIFYVLECPTNLALERLAHRKAGGDTGNLIIDENAYHSLKQYFEPIQDDEEHTAIESYPP